MGSAGLHAILLAVLLPFVAEPSDAPAPVTTSVATESRLELEPPPPPPPDDFVPPERVEDEAPPEDAPTLPDLLAEGWDEERQDEVREAIRSTIHCADPFAASDRFGPRPSRSARGPAVAEPPAPPAIPPVEVIAPPPPSPTPAHVQALVRPHYPRTARERGLEGEVTLRAVVLADGTLDSLDIVQSSGYAVLDRAALTAVEGWTFVAATVRGIPVRSTLDLPPIRFRLKD